MLVQEVTLTDYRCFKSAEKKLTFENRGSDDKVMHKTHGFFEF